jgi:starch synthase
MPSRFEPCGLTQLYALRYGCIPVVCATGGLADTITDVDDQSLKDGTATGFQFQEPATSSLVTAVRRALAMRRGDARAWQRLVTSAMQKDFSWQNSARGYARLFADLISATPYRPVGRLP